MNDPLQHSEQNSESELMLRKTLRFLNTLWLRKWTIILATLAGAILGGLQLATFKPGPDRFTANVSVRMEEAGGSLNMQRGMRFGRVRNSELCEQFLLSGEVLGSAIEMLDELPPEVDRSAPKDQMILKLRETLSIRTNEQFVTQLACTSTSRDAPIGVVNAVVEAAGDFVKRTQTNLSAMSFKALETEREELETKLLLKERELLDVQQKFGGLGIGNGRASPRRSRGKSGSDSGGGSTHPLIARTTQLGRLYSEAQTRTVSLQAALVALESSINAGANLAPHLALFKELLGEERVASFRETEDKEVVTKIRQEIVESQRELAAVQNFYAQNHPRIRKLTESLRQNQASLNGALNLKAQEWKPLRDPKLGAEMHALLNAAYKVEQTRQAAVHKMFKESEAEASHLLKGMAQVQLVRNEANLLKRMHTSVATRLARSGITSGNSRTELSVVGDPPKSARRIAQPTPARQVPLFVVAGLLAGIAIVYVMDTLDDRFRSPDEVKELLGIELLGAISELPPLSGEGIDALCVHTSPQSVESEAFRTLRTTLEFSGADTSRLAITSSEPHDGKTTVIANFAVACVLAGKRTLLVDADLRSPGLTRLFNMRGLRGLSRILMSPENVVEAATESIRETGVTGLDIVPCGPKPPNPSELLSQPAFAEFIAWAEDNYDQILIDCPPILAASDAAIVGRLVDGLALVVQPSKNRRKLVTRAAEALRSVGVEITGVIANRIRRKDQNYGYGYGYGNTYGYGHDEPFDTDAEHHSAETCNTAAASLQDRPRDAA